MTPIDHHGADLRGRVFADAPLDGADFRKADLRGADLSGASLKDATFVGAALGLRPLAKGLLFAAALLLVGAAGWLIGWTLRDLIDGISGSEWEEAFGRALGALVIGAFILFVVLFGLVGALRYVAITFLAALVIKYAVVLVSEHSLDIARDARGLAVLVLLGASLVAGGVARVVGGTFAPWSIVIVGLAGGLAAGQAGGGAAGAIVSAVLMLMAKRALNMDERDHTERWLVHKLVSRQGTKFTNADLRGADFTDTHLEQCDLTGADTDGAKLDGIRGYPPYLAPTPES